ncbi:MAG: protein kinase [Paramuribaculum sp.]|nr:protein kinase [Paramuribaculum sp.]
MEPTNPSSTDKWTEIEHLPEWDEEFYEVYTAKKYGKWVMMKTLRPQFKDDPRFQSMIEKEFDVRYNLAHPGIIMINDFEDVPGLGRCIITDDVYGESLRKLITENRVEQKHLDKICTQMIDAMDYIQLNHIVHLPIKPETIIFTENIGNLKLIDVGFDQKETLSPADATDDIYCFGKILSETLDHVPDAPSHLRKVAEKCLQEKPSDRYRSIHELRMALAKRSDNRLYLAVIIFILIAAGLLIWLGATNFSRPSSAATDTIKKTLYTTHIQSINHVC